MASRKNSLADLNAFLKQQQGKAPSDPATPFVKQAPTTLAQVDSPAPTSAETPAVATPSVEALVEMTRALAAERGQSFREVWEEVLLAETGEAPVPDSLLATLVQLPFSYLQAWQRLLWTPLSR